MTRFTRQNPPAGFYTYAYLREDGRPYYIGKGKTDRAWGRHGSVTKPWQPPCDERILFLKWGMTEDAAHVHEMYMIAVYGNHYAANGWLTLNFTNGGEGTSGYAHTDDTKARISLSNKKDSYPHLVGRPVSDKTRERIAAPQRGKILPADQIAKIKAARARQVITQEHKDAIGRALLGKTHSPESRRRMSEAADPAVKKAAALIGWQKSPCRGGNISAAKMKPQVWSHPEHGEIVCAAKELKVRFGVNNLDKVKSGKIAHSKGWTWIGPA